MPIHFAAAEGAAVLVVFHCACLPVHMFIAP